MNVGADSGRVSVWVWASFPCGIGIGQSTPRDLEILHFYLFIIIPLGGKPQDLVEKVEVFAHVALRPIHTSRKFAVVAKSSCV